MREEAPFSGTIVQRAVTGDATFSETAHDPLTQLAKHSHARASFCLVVDGRFREQSARGASEYRLNDVIFRGAREWHADEFSSEGARCFNIEIGSEILSGLDTGHEANARAVAKLMRQMRREVRLGAEAPLVIEGILYQIVGEAFQRRSPAPRSRRWLDEVERILERRFREKLTVRGIAEEIELHPVHLARAYRRARGLTIADAVRTRRIEEAQRLLKDSAMPLAEVALCCGFADQSHFTKTFRRFVGVTPLTYRLTKQYARSP